jgi:DNA-binding transcriptional MerR regulator
MVTQHHPASAVVAETSEEDHSGALVALRIGEVARLAGLTTRTLRYWEEVGLITPSGYRNSGERMYSSDDVARAARIRELQELLGFSLAEVRIVLDTEDVFEGLRSVVAGDPCDPRLLQMIDDAIVANERLLGRLDDTLVRVHAFRDERAAKAERLRAGRAAVAARRHATPDDSAPSSAAPTSAAATGGPVPLRPVSPKSRARRSSRPSPD